LLAVDSDLRTLPADAALLAFYICRRNGSCRLLRSAGHLNTLRHTERTDGRDSIARTLEANVPQVKRLKILIHGQELDTLAGHVDLTQILLSTAKLYNAVRSLLTCPPASHFPMLLQLPIRAWRKNRGVDTGIFYPAHWRNPEWARAEASGV